MSSRKYLHVSISYQRQDYRNEINSAIDINTSLLDNVKKELRGDTIVILKEFDKPLDKQRELFQNNPARYLNALVDVVKNSPSNKNVLYCLLTLNGILIDSHNNLKAAADGVRANKDDNILTVLSQVLHKFDYHLISYESAAHSAAQVLGFLDKNGFGHKQKEQLLYVIGLNKLGRASNQPRLSDLAQIQTLVHYLKHEHLVKPFTDNRGLEIIKKNFNEGQDLQIHYYNLVALWEISEIQYGLNLFSDPQQQLIYSITQVLSKFSREKLVRVSSRIFSNLQSNEECLQLLLDHNVYKICEIQLKSNIKDEDIINNLTKLQETLEQNERILSSFEKYEKELLSGTLKPGAMHTEKFWKEHYRKFESNQFKYIKVLVKMLDENNNTTTNIALACNDLGEFCRFHRYGADIIDSEDLKAKNKIMSLANKEGLDPLIRENALIALQKIMLNNWQQVS